jgi:hypothetical protein
MGKPTGFIEYLRELPSELPTSDRESLGQSIKTKERAMHEPSKQELKTLEGELAQIA